MEGPEAVSAAEVISVDQEKCTKLSVQSAARIAKCHSSQLKAGQYIARIATARRGSTKMKGTVKFFNASKGFGFITAEDGSDYFVHLTGLKAGVTLKDGAEVEFDVVQGDRGPKAANVSTL